MKKTLTVLLALVLVIAMSVAGTMAYLTDKDTVTNTFTVGKVAITLDETDVDVYGVKDGETRVDKNTYRLIPGHTYVKDPIIHFQPDSEASWLFVELENGIKDIVDAKTIENQILDKGWALLSGTENVYYKAADANNGPDAKVVDYPVFDNFKLTGNANVAAYDGLTIKVTAYAVQMDSFENDPVKAWTTTFGAPAAPTPTT